MDTRRYLSLQSSLWASLLWAPGGIDFGEAFLFLGAFVIWFVGVSGVITA